MSGTCGIYVTHDKFLQNFRRKQEHKTLERPMEKGMIISKWVIKMRYEFVVRIHEALDKKQWRTILIQKAVSSLSS
jgi:hypothetical protein